MAGDREKTAGEAAREKAERRERVADGATPEEAAEAVEQAAATEAAQRSTQEREQDLSAGTVEPGGVKPTEADGEKSTEQLREEVEQAREQLADSVEELTGRVDPRPKIADARERIEAGGRTLSDNAVPIAVAASVVIIGLVLLRRRR